MTSHYHGGSLHSKRFQSSYWAKVRVLSQKSCPSFLDEPREETLATQATMVVKYLDHNNGELNENGKKAVGLY